MKKSIVKKFSALLTSMVLVLSFGGVLVFAAEPLNAQNSSGTADLVEINKSTGISPQTTVPGNIGAASIRWINSGQIYWSVIPYDKSAQVIFGGEITITNLSNGSIALIIPVGGLNYGGVEDNEFFSGLKAGYTYQATLTGSGYSNDEEFQVADGCWEMYYVGGGGGMSVKS